MEYSKQLIALFEELQTIDVTLQTNDPKRLSTDWLFGPARGKMFGVLECLDKTGQTVILRAFSGQYNGQWLVPGWMPPLFDVDTFNLLYLPVEKKIKEFGVKMENASDDHAEQRFLKQKRRLLSKRLMQELHALYRLHNFRGEQSGLAQVFTGEHGIPTGTGDCCAPKLLNYAAMHGLTPIGLAEFYWGKENPSKTRNHGCFSQACQEKCEPILGFLLCGL
jgi:hypothetical protein